MTNKKQFVKGQPCPRHDRRYELLKSSALCCHPKCVKSLIVFYANKNQSIMRMLVAFEAVCMDDDLINHLIEKLMEEEKLGKQAVINKTWLYFNMGNYLRKKLIKPLADETFDTIVDGELYQGGTGNPEFTYMTKEILELAKECEESEVLLYLTGELTQTDAMRVFGCTAKQLNEKVELFREELKKKI